MLHLPCPACYAIVSVPDEAAGTDISCPRCWNALFIPANDPYPVLDGHTLVETAPVLEMPRTKRSKKFRRRFDTVVLALGLLAAIVAVVLAVGYSWRPQPPLPDTAGEGKGPPDQKDDKSKEAPPVPRRELTADEKNSWDKFRRFQKKKTYKVAGYFHARKSWELCGDRAETAEGFVDQTVPNEDVTLPPRLVPGDRRAEEFARTAAAQPAVKVAVVLDMYSQPSPVMVRCYWDEDGVAREADRLSSAELRDALRAFILDIQRTASFVQ